MENDAFADWSYFVAVGTEEGGNPDLFVSVIDGRNPSRDDNDFASVQYGADSVTISSRDAIWARRGLNVANGVFVVVSVYERESTAYTVVLTKKPEADSPID